MNTENALDHVLRSLREGAELRAQVGRDCGSQIVQASAVMVQALQSNGKLMFFGNGGSAADAQHLAAEFVGRFVGDRPGLAAIALTTDSSILTAVGNDLGFDQVFARQIEALGRPGDVAIGISTSGKSPNVIEAVKKAIKQGIRTIGFSGNDGAALAKSVDIPITVRAKNTARIQECHITIGHILCELVERELFGS
jgi:D-sedoheptulose 7-phosphate isomerase